MLQIYDLNGETCPSQLFQWTELFLHFGWKLAKHPSTQAAYKTDPILSDNQTFINLQK